MTVSRSNRNLRGLFILALASLILVLSVASRAADASFYVVAKGHLFNQNSTAQPVPKGSPDRFSAIVGLATTNSVTNVTVQGLPSGSANSLALQSGGAPGIADQFNFTGKFTNSAALDTAFPNGSYKLAIQAVHDGVKSLTLALNGDSYPVSVPYLNNFTAAQTVNAAAGFTLTWPAFSGGTANDVILVSIADSTGAGRFSSPDPGQPGALNGTATSLVIPPNILPSGAFLGGALTFAKVVSKDTTSYPGVPGFAAYFTQTQFSLNTVAAATLPSLSVVFTNAAGPFQILLTGQVGGRYAIDGSTNLQKGPWLSLFTNTASGGQFLFIDSQFRSSSVRFYRGRSAN